MTLEVARYVCDQHQTSTVRDSKNWLPTCGTQGILCSRFVMLEDALARHLDSVRECVDTSVYLTDKL